MEATTDIIRQLFHLIDKCITCFSYNTIREVGTLGAHTYSRGQQNHFFQPSEKTARKENIQFIKETFQDLQAKKDEEDSDSNCSI